MSPSLLQHVARTIFPTSLGLQPFPGLSSADVQWLQAAGVPGNPSVCPEFPVPPLEPAGCPHPACPPARLWRDAVAGLGQLCVLGLP